MSTPTTAPPVTVPPLRKDRMVLGWTAAYGISIAGDEVWYVALTWSAAQLGSPAFAGLVLACASVPSALFLLIGGALADRLDTRRLMIGSDLARVAVLVLAVGVLLITEPSASLLIGVAVLFGIVDALYRPASGTLTRQLVAKSDLARVAGIRQLSHRFGQLGGAPLGGLIVAVSGLGGAMAVDALSFAVIALVLLGIKPRWPLQRAGGRSVLGDVREGLKYLRGTPQVRDLVIALSALNVFVTPAIAIGVALRTHAEGWGASGLGWLTGSLGVGAALGTTVAMKWRPEHPAFVGLAVLLSQPVAIACIGFAPFAGTLAGMVLVGAAAGVASPMLSGAFQATVGEQYLGRSAAVVNIADAGLAPLALAGFGALAGAASVAVACAVFAVGYLLLLAYGASRPHIRTLRIDPATP